MRTFTSLNALCCQKKWGDVRKWKLFLNFLFRKASRQLIQITHWLIYSMSMLNGLLCGLNYTNFICNLGNVEHVHNSVLSELLWHSPCRVKPTPKRSNPKPDWAVSMDIYPLLQCQSSSGSVGKSIWPAFRRPRFKSWLDLNVVFHQHCGASMSKQCIELLWSTCHWTQAMHTSRPIL